MIEITVFHSSQGICAFSLKGHSGYAEEGADIVCAAVSSIAQYIIEAVVHTMKVPSCYECRDGFISLSLAQTATNQQKQRVQDFLIPFETVMRQLSSQYKNYLKICSLEV